MPVTLSFVDFSISVYLVNSETSGQSSSQKLSGSVINALVIVGVIALATFILVACYYYRCLKVCQKCPVLRCFG